LFTAGQRNNKVGFSENISSTVRRYWFITLVIVIQTIRSVFGKNNFNENFKNKLLMENMIYYKKTLEIRSDRNTEFLFTLNRFSFTVMGPAQ